MRYLTWRELLLAKFPAFDPNWTPEVQEKWWMCFRTIQRLVREEGAGRE